MSKRECDRQSIPECPYNCPYDPSEEERQLVEDAVVEREIADVDFEDRVMTAIIRDTDLEGDVHFQKVWESDFGPKVGVKSQPEFSEVFDQLDWEKSHHKWNSDRVTGTDMWEVDLDSIMYVAFYFVREDIDVTIDDEVREKYLRQMENLPLE